MRNGRQDLGRALDRCPQLLRVHILLKLAELVALEDVGLPTSQQAFEAGVESVELVTPSFGRGQQLLHGLRMRQFLDCFSLLSDDVNLTLHDGKLALEGREVTRRLLEAEVEAGDSLLSQAFEQVLHHSEPSRDLVLKGLPLCFQSQLVRRKLVRELLQVDAGG